MVSLDFSVTYSFRPFHGPGVESAPQWKCVPGTSPGGKGGRCVRLTTSPPSCAECHGIWMPVPPGTLWATPGLLRDSMWPCIVIIIIFIIIIIIIIIIKPTRWLISQIYFGMKLYMFRTFPLSIIRSLFTVHSFWAGPGSARKVSTNLYDIYHCWVYSE